MPLWHASAERRIPSASAAPDPSPNRMSKSSTAVLPIASSRRLCPGSTLRCPTRQWSSAAGASAKSGATEAVQMNPSRITGIRRCRAASTAPQIAACSRPPKVIRIDAPSCGVAAWRASPRVMASTLRRRPSSSEPVPRPTQSCTAPPKTAAVSAAATVEFPIPISPRIKTLAAGCSAAAPALRAATQSASVIAGACVKSAVGRSRSRSITDSCASLVRHNWLIAAPPALKFCTIWAVTSCGKGFTPCAQIPWLPAKTRACAMSICGTACCCHPAMNTASSSSRPSDPGGLVSAFCRSRAAS